MRTPILAAAALASAASSAAPVAPRTGTPQVSLPGADPAAPSTPLQQCRRLYHPAPAGAGVRAELRKLDELPPANLVLAVYNQVDGCPVPVIVRYGLGGEALRGR
jgi:hypothetical protein